MEATRQRPPAEIYHTTNQTYGTNWQAAQPLQNKVLQNAPSMSSQNQDPAQLQRGRPYRVATASVHSPSHPCGIMTMTNIPTNTRGQFTNTGRDFYSDQQGLWANSCFNTPGATLERGVGTYSNLQGAWSRIGPSTYDASHGKGSWVPRWHMDSFEPATLRSMYGHRNVDPRDNWVPIETHPLAQTPNV